MAMAHQLPVAGVVEAVIARRTRGLQDLWRRSTLIGIMSRTFGEAACLQELDALLAHRDHITALDLAGDELGFPGSLFLSHFNQGTRCRLAYLPCMRAKPRDQKASGRPLKS